MDFENLSDAELIKLLFATNVTSTIREEAWREFFERITIPIDKAIQLSIKKFVPTVKLTPSLFENILFKVLDILAENDYHLLRSLNFENNNSLNYYIVLITVGIMRDLFIKPSSESNTEVNYSDN